MQQYFSPHATTNHPLTSNSPSNYSKQVSVIHYVLALPSYIQQPWPTKNSQSTMRSKSKTWLSTPHCKSTTTRVPAAIGSRSESPISETERKSVSALAVVWWLGWFSTWYVLSSRYEMDSVVVAFVIWCWLLSFSCRMIYRRMERVMVLRRIPLLLTLRLWILVWIYLRWESRVEEGLRLSVSLSGALWRLSSHRRQI